MRARDTKRCLLRLPTKQSVLLMGDHGIGKSQIVKQVADELGIPCIDFRLSQNDVGDLKGMPFHVRGRTVFAPPEFMPLTEADAIQLKELLGLTEDIHLGRYGDKGILFLDGINRANREVQQAAFELVLDHRMNLRPLPEGWRVVAAINDDDDIYTVNAMEMAFLSRFYVIKFEPSQEEWFEWANDNNIHPAILEFLRRMPDYIDPSKEMLKEASVKGVTKVHDRRAWHMFSDGLYQFEKDHEAGVEENHPLDKKPDCLSFLQLMATGYVGTMAATEFRGFIEKDYNALDGNTILNEWDANIEKQIMAVVRASRIPELAAYNTSVLAWIEKNVKDKLSDKQKRNLSKYLGCLTNEPISDFWKKFNQDMKKISEDWYQSDKANAQLMLKALVNPELLRKNQAKAAAK